MDEGNWRKAKASFANGGCVEVANTPGEVLVRDTRDREGPVLHLTPGQWRDLLGWVRRT